MGVCVSKKIRVGFLSFCSTLFFLLLPVNYLPLVFFFCLIISLPVSNFCFDRICINFSVFFCLFVIPQCLLLFFLSLFVTFSSISGASQHVPLTFYSACSLVKSHIYVTNIGYNFICFNHYLNAKNMAFRTLTILVFFIIIFYLDLGFPTHHHLNRARTFLFVCFGGHFVFSSSSEIVK